MLGILIDAVILMVLLNAINDDEFDFVPALLISFGASILAFIITIVFYSVLGIGAIFISGLVTAVLIGIAVSLFFGAEIKRAMLIGVLFVIAHFAVGVIFSLMFSSA